MAVFCNKTSIETLRKRMPEKTKRSMMGGGIGSTDVTSYPQTIDEQPVAKKVPTPQERKLRRDLSEMPAVKTTPQVSADPSMAKTDMTLSEEELSKMLEEA